MDLRPSKGLVLDESDDVPLLLCSGGVYLVLFLSILFQSSLFLEQPDRGVGGELIALQNLWVVNAPDF